MRSCKQKDPIMKTRVRSQSFPTEEMGSGERTLTEPVTPSRGESCTMLSCGLLGDLYRNQGVTNSLKAGGQKQIIRKKKILF